MSLSNILIVLRKKPNKREKILFGVLIASLILIFLKSFLWENHQQIKALKESINLAAVEQKKNLNPMVLPLKQEKNWIGMAADVKDISDTIFNSFHLQDLKIIKNQFSKVVQQGGRYTRAISLSVSGRYSTLQGYLAHLENMPTPFVVNSLNIQISDEDSDILMMDINGDIYGSN